MQIKKNIILLVLALELINIVYFSLFLYFNKYLPAPFLWDKNNAFMDFYNPLFWVLKDEFYTNFKSVYPPVNYLFLKLFTFNLDASTIIDPFKLREENTGPIYFLIAINLTVLYLILKVGEWREITNGKRVLIWASIVFSTPVLFAMERGNLIFIPLLLLAIYMAVENVWIKAILFGLLVNFKPYFIILLVEYLNIYRFNLKIISKIIIISWLIFFLSSLAPGLDILAFISNYNDFGSRANFSNDGLLALPNTFESLIQLIKLMFKSNQESYVKNFLTVLLKILKIFVPATFLLLLLLVPLKKQTLGVALILLVGNFSHVTSGYIYITYILIVPFILREEELRGGIIPLLTIFVMPFDWVKIPGFSNHIGVIDSYFGGVKIYDVDLWLGFGTLLRPLSNFFLMCLMLKFITKSKNA